MLPAALDLARQDKSPRLEARARLALGSLSTQEGSFDEAVSHLESALKFYQPAGYRTETSNALILLGRVYRDKGVRGRHESIFRAAGIGEAVGDPARLAATHSSIGVLLGTTRSYPEALPISTRVIGSTSRSARDAWDGIRPIARRRCGVGEYDGARALSTTYSIAAGPGGFKSQLAYVELIGAQMALQPGQPVEATTRATAALKLAERDYKDTALKAKDARAHRGDSGAPKKAMALVEEAVGAARRLKLPRLLSTALLASAEVRIAGGDGRGALADAQAAQKVFASAAQLESEWRAWLVSARSMRLEGDSSTAYDYAVRAESSRAALQARWGEDNYRGYVRRPDIQVRLKQLGQLLGRRRSFHAQKEAEHGR